MLNKMLNVVVLVLIAGHFVFGQTREVALTFDDLPATQRGDSFEFQKYVTDTLLQKLTSEKVPAIGFVNENRITRSAIETRTFVASSMDDC